MNRIPLIPKNAIDNAEALARVEIMQINRQRRLAGQLYLSKEEQETILQKHNAVQHQDEQKARDLQKQYGISNEALTSLLAMFSTKRQEAIAKASQKDTQIILEFKERKPPKLGEKPGEDSQRFSQLSVHYNRVPWDVYEEIQAIQGRLGDLNRLKQMTLSVIDQDGKRIREAVLQKNNPDITGMTDAEFSQLSRKIAETQMKLYQTAGLWMYGLPAERTTKCETLTLSLAIEAGLYRLQYGFPAENPNYDSFLK